MIQIKNTFYGDNASMDFPMSPDEKEYEDIIRVIDGPEGTKKLCLIRIFKKAGSKPRPVIELERPDEQYFTYEVLEEFENIPAAKEYSVKNEILDVEY